MTNTQITIHETIAEIKRLISVQKHFNNTTKQLENSYLELNALEDQLVEELEDIEKLEKMSIKAVFYKVLGSQEEQLEKERQEYLKVSLKHKELKKSIELLEYEHKIIRGKIQEIAGLEAKLEKLKQTRMQEIIQTDENLSLKISGIHSEMDTISDHIEELKQAHLAGQNSLNAIGIVIKHLKDAEQWGNWDMMNKQGAYYSQMKHNAIDRATNAAHQAKHKIQIFDEELNDVNIESTGSTVNIESFGRFLDIFFDNLISDWVVQRKIKNALNNVESTYDKITRYVGVIDKEITIYNEKQRSLQQDIDNILES